MLSIIIPTLNEEEYLGDMLAKLTRGLTEHEYEIIVADGGSKDRTVEIAKRFGSAIEYHGAERITIASQRNKGAAKARGEFLVFMDSGVEVPSPDKFFRIALERFRGDNRLMGLAPWLDVLPNIETFADKVFGALFNYLFWFENNVLRIGGAPGKLQIVRKAAFEAIGGFREDLVAAEDLDLFRRLSQHGRTFFARDLVVYHPARRVHAIGWRRMIWIWTKNSFTYAFLGRSHTKDWYLEKAIGK